MVINQNTTSIIFTGDIAFDKYMDNKWNDKNLLSDDILAFCHSADHVVANVEGPVSSFEQDSDASGMAALFHTIDPAATSLLQKIHADIWNINNNHIMDIGDKGLIDTLNAAKACKAVAIGAGRNIVEAAAPIYFPQAGGIGMFSIGYRGNTLGCKPASSDKCGCFQWSEYDLIKRNITDIKSHCRWCIIVCHGGEEFTSLPSPYVRERYLSLLDMGADLIICHHPHVPNNYETFPGKAIFYSLGNFIFDTDYQRSQYNTEKGVLLKLQFSSESFSFEPLGIEICRDSEHIVKASLPDIFTDIKQEEYEKLAPLAAKMHVQAFKRQQLFLYPDQFTDMSEEKWEKHFMDPDRFERIAGEILDFRIIYPLSVKAADGAWKNSSLSKVKDYILAQMEPPLL